MKSVQREFLHRMKLSYNGWLSEIRFSGSRTDSPGREGFVRPLPCERMNIVHLTREQVLHVARLASLSLTPEEESHFAGELSHILDYVEKLNRLKLPPPGLQVGEGDPVPTSLPDDLSRPSIPVAEALFNAPDQSGQFFRVPRILEEGR
ncbi:Asp-tRNA(Asn)/Glu-tRNA(Gln) amidotransferase subunit GatC [Leptospirillum ferriphilum]|uniref:Aspartyl/glutamyl-tRNA(Asn/Gln) amidotransferase subunit C n=1 Tax=Leptospirillum ferriphilum (strain ML-04) TaxID=1048260 RepID=J9ZEG9_LEPFM|nr:Asp-tRNA(Asn)/Glu-tRNA(Gln) amidotransferase subunit GatC [Leptospirillum ferriphilum]AFS54263.1 glutamyl-tRNA(Gln) amidotransferase, C subunit [Leptospirillum ferriphilum ML-04]